MLVFMVLRSTSLIYSVPHPSYLVASGQIESAGAFNVGNTTFSVLEGPDGHMLLQFPSSVQLVITEHRKGGNSEKSGHSAAVIAPKTAPSKTEAPVPTENPKPRRPRSRTARERHACHLCTKTFVAARDLRTHLLKHQGHKPFHCHLCPARFLARSYLADHLQSHLKTKRWKCDMCPKSFLRPAHLTHHKERSHPNRVWLLLQSYG